MNFDVIEADGAKLVKTWTRGVLFEEKAKEQVINLARMPFIHQWVAIMPDVHWGMGATIGSVIPTVGAIIPAAVGVDIGCGMMAQRTSIRVSELPSDVRSSIESKVPHGRSNNGGKGDRGAWSVFPKNVEEAWEGLDEWYQKIISRHPKLSKANSRSHLGTLGGGNHFIEVCVDEEGYVWLMLHSGSRCS